MHATIINIIIVAAAPIMSPSPLFVWQSRSSPIDPHKPLSLSISHSETSSVLMAKEWEMMDFTMGVGMASAPPAAPFTASSSPAATYLYGSIPPIVDELLDLSPHRHEDCFPLMEGVAPGAPTPFSEFNPLQGPNSSFDLYIPVSGRCD